MQTTLYIKYTKRSLSLFFIAVFVFIHLLTLAQTGPGGVGSSATNTLWLLANQGVYNDAGTTLAGNGNTVQEWFDQSGNSNKASQTTAGYKPTFVTGVVNNLPVVRFDGTDDYFDDNRTYSARTVLIVYNIKNTLQQTTDLGQLWGNYAEGVHVALDARAGGGTWSFDGNAANQGKFGLNSAAYSALAANPATPTWTYNQFDIVSVEFNATRSLTRQVIGSLIPTFAVGVHQYGGDIAEIIVFNTTINDAQRIIVENYLSSKYGITLSANDKFAYDATYGNQVAGIGRKDASNTHTDAQSASILEVNTASSLGNGDYLLFGHDGGAIASWTTTEAPNSGTDIKRIAREWRLNETDGGGGDGVGTMKFIIDTTLLPARTATFTKYVLMVDADGDFSSGASVYEMSSPGANKYFETASTIDINDGDYVTIAEVRPTIQFSSATSSGFETANASIAVTLNYIAKTAVSVTYNTADGTAVAGAPGDYTAVAGGTLTVPVGSSSANITITINNDVTVESDETFTTIISAPPAGINLGTNTINTYSIRDDDNTRKIYFTAASSSGSEGTTPVSITVTIDVAQIDATNPTTVDYSVTGGTATGAGTDYTLAAGTATIAANTQSTTISLAINDDGLYEPNETVIISLSNPTNGNLSSTNPIVYTYTINDNDSPPVIQFSSTSSSGLESVSSVNFQVSQNIVSYIASTVAYTVTGTATGGGTDYTLANGTLTIPAGSTSANITATIVDDAIVEFSETIVITLSAPTNSTLGANTVYTYTISDNDVFGYTGPGGVGDLSTNKLWLMANQGVYNNAGTTLAGNGNTVQEWFDQSGNSNKASQTTAGYKPTFVTAVVNNLPVVRFDGTDDYFDDNRTYSARTVLIVYNIKNTLQQTTDLGQIWGNYAEGVQVALDARAGGGTWSFDGNSSVSNTGKLGLNSAAYSAFAATLATPKWTYNQFDIVTVEFNATRSLTRQVIGSLVPTFAVGVHQFGGDVAEIIVFNTTINTAQRIIAENYLSSKYGVTLSANDKFAYDATYGIDVAGIGMEDASNYHTDARGTGIVRMNNASSMNTGDYLLWGHNNTSFATRDSTDVPTAEGVTMRMGRVWRASEAGEIGTMDISFDMTGLGSVTTSDLRLLIDKTNNGFADETVAAGTVISGATSVGGNVYKFSGVNIDNSWSFTLGSINKIQTPLPIKLISFKATPTTNTVNLKWTTESEINNDFFTVEKSQDGNNFTFVSIIKGAGNSTSILNYSSVDDDPYPGISYYRLKQTDFDGKYSYSNIVAVEFNKANDFNLKVFPNPSTEGGHINLSFTANKGEEILVVVYDATGKKDFSKIIITQTDGDNVYAIDESHKLTSGIYFITATSNQTIYSKKLIVR